MKIIVPKNIEGGMFDMGIDIGMFRMKMWQLFLLAIGLGLALSIFNGLSKSGLGNVLSIIISSPAMILFLFIAFFRKSELYIIPFVVKLVRTYMINAPKTFQKNIVTPAQWEIKLQYAKMNKSDEQAIIQKTLDKDKIEDETEKLLSKW